MGKSRWAYRAVAVAIAAMSWVVPEAFGAEGPDEIGTTALREDTVDIRTEIKRLRSDIDQLQREVADLRRVFSAAPSDSGVVAAPDTTTRAVAPTQRKYWLTTSSKTRHNSSCRFYQKGNGRPCSSKEGRPCKRCGG